LATDVGATISVETRSAAAIVATVAPSNNRIVHALPPGPATSNRADGSA
jgi:hypothetical protein